MDLPILTVRAQTLQFLGCCLLGLPAGLFFDAFRLLRAILPHPSAAVFAEDLLWTAGCALMLLCYITVFADGVFQVWMPVGFVLGFALYLLTVGMLTARLMHRSRLLRGFRAFFSQE